MRFHNILRSSTASLAVTLLMPMAAPASAQGRMTYHLPAQPLADTLRAIATQSGRSIIAPAEILRGKAAVAIDGALSVDDAVAAALAGSGLRARHVAGGIVVEIVRDAADPGTLPSGADIVVTGSRIRGTAPTSTVITKKADEMRDAGQTDLGSVVRAIPQSFGGGQNPGIGSNVPTASGIDVSGGSSINLRGLGSDATLTLINGHRLAYNASRQSIDVSAIPIEAVDRLEIVPDGSSAIYGSDAVAGVANIILRRDYRGIEIGARIAGTTDGGGFQQQYDAIAGTTWTGGGVLAAYDYGDASALLSDQRSYTKSSATGLSLLPAMRRHSALVTGHQALTDTLTFSVDALFNSRISDQQSPANDAGDFAVSGQFYEARDRSWALAPSLAWEMGDGWRSTLSADYGKERVDVANTSCAGTTCALASAGYYRNTERSADLGASGPLFSLPGGDAKLAIGAGYRAIDFRRDDGPGGPANTAHAQDSYFAYGELDLPLVGPAQGLPLLHRVDLNAAVRYERYPGIGEVATPRLGLTIAPSADVSLRASWGRSFRAPTLFQQYQPGVVYLYPAAPLGGTGLPATAATLLKLGGNPELKPERARTWSVGLDIHPRGLGGARLQVSYFNVDYRDRIVVPITYLNQALRNSIYAGQVVAAPDAAAQQAVIAAASTFLNFTGHGYDPASVVAIIDNANRNAGRQRARGVDILADDTIALGPDQRLRLALNASYLESDQQLSAAQPLTQLAGAIFNPPHWRGNATIGWSLKDVTVTGVVYRIGGVTDIRQPSPVAVHGMTTFDLTVGYSIPKGRGALAGTRLTVSAQNLFNAKPGTIMIDAGYEAPYDSTNYSPLGRLLSIGLSRSW